MKRFFETLKLSLTSKAFYQRVLEGKEPRGFKYFFWLNFIYSIVIVTVFIIPISILLTSSAAHQKFLSVIPADLVVTLDKGTTTINQAEPYIIPNTAQPNAAIMQKCNGDQKCIADRIGPKNAVVIDTKTPFTLESFNSYDTMVLVKGDMIATKKSNGQIQIIPNPKDIHLDLSRAWASNIIEKYSWIAWFIPVFAFIGEITLVYAFNLFVFIFWALVIWLILWIYKVKTTFGRAYSIAIYSSIVLTILDMLAYVIPFLRGNIVQVIVIAIFLYYMVRKNPENFGGVSTGEDKIVPTPVESVSVTPTPVAPINSDNTTAAVSDSEVEVLTAKRITDDDTV